VRYNLPFFGLDCLQKVWLRFQHGRQYLAVVATSVGRRLHPAQGLGGSAKALPDSWWCLLGAWIDLLLWAVLKDPAGDESNDEAPNDSP
jgi:hypothetical protein